MFAWLFRRREPLRTFTTETPRSAWVDVVTDRQAAKQVISWGGNTNLCRRLDEFEFDPSIDVQPLKGNP